MSAFFYGVALQWKLDLRSKTLLIPCYAVPLLYFGALAIFISISLSVGCVLGLLVNNQAKPP